MTFQKEEFLSKFGNLSNKFKSEPDKGALSERDICRKFIEPMFEALGWDVRGEDVKEQESQPDGRPDYVFYIEGKLSFFLETKKAKVLTETDIKQAVNYAKNRNKRWAVLSNFEETIILLCNTKEKHISRHVFRRVSLDRPESAEELFLLSKESFENGLIDGEAETEGRVKQTVRIDDELLDDILSWRKKLIDSIKENNPKETYSKETLEEIAQLILNRIIFMRTVEDRRQEAKPNETLYDIVQAYRNDGTISVQERVNRLFREYDRIYDSGLFTYKEGDPSARHECETAKIPNKTYFDILKGTYEKDDLYEYRFDAIPADILGSMYEKYIGRIQSHRKEQGIYYTPEYIVDYIVRNTLGEALKGLKKPKDAEKLKVLDMACGSGSFLLKAFEVLDEFYSENEKGPHQTKLGEEDVIKRKAQILQNNIFGVDLDGKAVEIAQLNLLLKAAETRHRLPMLKGNIRHGNSLIDDPKVSEFAFKWEDEFPEVMKDGGGFDVIIGNPPWTLSISNTEKIFLQKRFETAYGKPDLFRFFIQLGVDLVNQDGYFSLIVPNSWLSISSARLLRKYLLDKTSIQQIVVLPQGVFDISMNYVVFVVRKRQPHKGQMVQVIHVNNIDGGSLSKQTRFSILQEEWRKSDEYLFSVEMNVEAGKLITKILRKSVPLSSAAETALGLQAYHNTKHTKEQIENRIFHSKTKKGSDYLPELGGKNILRYSFDYAQNNWIKFGDWLYNYPPQKFFEGERIVIREIVGKTLFATLLYEPMCTYKTILNVKVGNKFLPKFILGILNSKTIGYIIKNTGSKSKQELFPRLSMKDLKKLPIPNAIPHQQENVSDLVDKMLSLNKKLSELGDKNTQERARLEEEIAKTDKEIDCLVYDLYGLTEEERKIVEESVK